MTDIVKQQRRLELAVRCITDWMGMRFRLPSKNLSSRLDSMFPKYGLSVSLVLSEFTVGE